MKESIYIEAKPFILGKQTPQSEWVNSYECKRLAKEQNGVYPSEI
jgi:hypothetical protein